jgi:hypothetical protein
MRRLYYSSGNFLLDDRVCKAVLRYARALAIADKSDLVSIPVVTDEGAPGNAFLLIGPASEIFSMPVGNDSADAYDAEAVHRLEKMTAALQGHVPAWEAEMTDIPSMDL